MDKFAYLGITLSRAVHIVDEVTVRIAKASLTFGRLRGNDWDLNGTRLGKGKDKGARSLMAVRAMGC